MKKITIDTEAFPWLDSYEVIQLLHISYKTLYRLRTRGIIGSTYFGHKLYFSQKEILDIMKNHYQMYHMHNSQYRCRIKEKESHEKK